VPQERRSDARVPPLLKLLDVLFLIRPPLLCVSSTFFFVGAAAALRSRTGSYGPSLMLGALPSLGAYLIIVAVAFTVNQIFDARSDAINRKNFLLPSGLVSRRQALVLVGVLCALLFALCWERTVMFVVLVVAGLSLAFGYSIPPVRLKARPIADMLANVAGFGWIGFLLGWLVFGELGRQALVRSIPYAVSMGAVFLNTCIPDEDGDRAVGDRTTCVAFGARVVSLWALALMGLAVVAGIVVDEPIAVVAALTAIPGFVAVALRQTAPSSVLASQLAAFVLFALAAICAPVLAVLGAVTYLGSRLYYRRRLRIGYPRLGGADLGGRDVLGAGGGEARRNAGAP
jgi:4-hydroxybenzoate polyprenyltransferase